MQKILSRLRFWLVLLAFVCHAMSPVLSHAMLAKSGKSLVEICTPDGFKTIEVDEAGKSTPSLKHYPHCGECLGANDAPVDIPRLPAALPSAAEAGVVKLSAGVFAYASAIRVHSQPRAPPLFS